MKSILEMDWKEIEEAYQPKDAFKDLTREEAIKLCREFANRIYTQNQEIASLRKQISDNSWELSSLRAGEAGREQAMRSAQGIFG